MVAKLIDQTRYCCVTLLSLVFAIVSIRVGLQNTYQPIDYIFSYHMDAKLQKELQVSIAKVFEANVRSTSAQTIYNSITGQYPYIKEIQLHKIHYPHTKKIITVKQEKPYMVINDVLIITQDGHQAPKISYPSPLYEGIIHANSNSLDAKDLYNLYQFTRKLPPMLLQNYSILWRDRTLIELHHTTEPYNIKVSTTVNFDNSMLKAIAAIINYVEIKKDLPKNRNAQWVMDVRCKDQIILAMKKGGN